MGPEEVAAEPHAADGSVRFGSLGMATLQGHGNSKGPKGPKMAHLGPGHKGSKTFVTPPSAPAVPPPEPPRPRSARDGGPEPDLLRAASAGSGAGEAVPGHDSSRRNSRTERRHSHKHLEVAHSHGSTHSSAHGHAHGHEGAGGDSRPPSGAGHARFPDAGEEEEKKPLETAEERHRRVSDVFRSAASIAAHSTASSRKASLSFGNNLAHVAIAAAIHAESVAPAHSAPKHGFQRSVTTIGRDETTLRDLLTKKPEARTIRDLSRMLVHVRETRFFQANPMDEGVLLEICRSLTYLRKFPQEHVFLEGDEGTTFYIILSGTVEVWRSSGRKPPPPPPPLDLPAAVAGRGRRRSSVSSVLGHELLVVPPALEHAPSAPPRPARLTPPAPPGEGGLAAPEGGGRTARSPRASPHTSPDPNARTVLATLKAGDAFGELALIKSEPRSASVTCSEACELMVLDRRDFDRTLRRWKERELSAKVEYLRRFACFHVLRLDRFSKLAGLFSRRAIPRNHVLLEQGRPVPGLYILRSGCCRVTREVELSWVPAPQPVNVLTPQLPITQRPWVSIALSVLAEGTLVGALELLREVPAMSTVVADTACELLFVPRAELVALLSEEASQLMRGEAEAREAFDLARVEKIRSVASCEAPHMGRARPSRNALAGRAPHHRFRTTIGLRSSGDAEEEEAAAAAAARAAYEPAAPPSPVAQPAAPPSPVAQPAPASPRPGTSRTASPAGSSRGRLPSRSSSRPALALGTPFSEQFGAREAAQEAARREERRRRRRERRAAATAAARGGLPPAAWRAGSDSSSDEEGGAPSTRRQRARPLSSGELPTLATARPHTSSARRLSLPPGVAASVWPIVPPLALNVLNAVPGTHPPPGTAPPSARGGPASRPASAGLLRPEDPPPPQPDASPPPPAAAAAAPPPPGTPQPGAGLPPPGALLVLPPPIVAAIERRAVSPPRTTRNPPPAPEEAHRLRLAIEDGQLGEYLAHYQAAQARLLTGASYPPAAGEGALLAALLTHRRNFPPAAAVAAGVPPASPAAVPRPAAPAHRNLRLAIGELKASLGVGPPPPAPSGPRPAGKRRPARTPRASGHDPARFI